MLAFVLRGVLFIGVVGWYSGSLWRMIDDYFKDQFQKYLEDEYRKNPKMRESVILTVTPAVDKPNSASIDVKSIAAVEEMMEKALDECSSNNDGIIESRSSVCSTISGATSMMVNEKEVVRPVQDFGESTAFLSEVKEDERKMRERTTEGAIVDVRVVDDKFERVDEISSDEGKIAATDASIVVE